MGAAGDMLMSAIYELLPDKSQFITKLNAAGIPHVQISPISARSMGVSGTKMQVLVGGAQGHERLRHNSGLGDIREIIASLDLPEAVLARATAVYERIAAAEAKVHGEPVELVHFHEVGALDAVADVVGVCYGVHLLCVSKIVASPVHVGSGTVKCAHGVLPVPAPATANLLIGAPCYSEDIFGELCTPTGAALLTELADEFGAMPHMTLEAIGTGIGTKEFSAPNCLRAFLGEATPQANGEICELVCNIDDMTAEALGFACTALLGEGALDVYTQPAMMKKGRSGQVLTVLCELSDERRMAVAMLRHTTTNGLRVRRCDKYFLTPAVEARQTPWGEVRIKRAEGFGVVHEKPEYDDIAKIAKRNNLPFHEVDIGE